MSARSRAVGLATLATILAGGIGAGAGWYVTDRIDDDQAPASTETATPTEEPSKLAQEMPPPMHTPEAEPPPVDAPHTHIDELYVQCDGGDMVACDELYWESPLGSSDELFASTCGGREMHETYGGCAATGDTTGEDIDPEEWGMSDKELFETAAWSAWHQRTEDEKEGVCWGAENVSTDFIIDAMRAEWDESLGVEFQPDVLENLLIEECDL